MTTRKIAILTAHKAYGKSDITKKILKSCSVSLLAQDCEIRDKMFDEFGECGNMDETLQMWGETHDRKKIHERLVELYTKALTQKQGSTPKSVG